MGLNSVWALVHVDDTPSLRLAERLGFLVVGRGLHYNGAHRVHFALPGQAWVFPEARPDFVSGLAAFRPLQIRE